MQRDVDNPEERGIVLVGGGMYPPDWNIVTVRIDTETVTGDDLEVGDILIANNAISSVIVEREDYAKNEVVYVGLRFDNGASWGVSPEALFDRAIRTW